MVITALQVKVLNVMCTYRNITTRHCAVLANVSEIEARHTIQELMDMDLVQAGVDEPTYMASPKAYEIILGVMNRDNEQA